MKAIERFLKYLEIKGIKPTRFEKDADISNGYLGTQLRRKGNLGEDIINKIIDNCLDLNIEWLITGNGNMLKPPSKTIYNNPEQYQHAEISTSVANETYKDELIKILTGNVKDLRKEVETLRQQLELKEHESS